MVNIWVLGRNGSITPWLNNAPIKMPTNTDNKAIRKNLMSPPASGMELSTRQLFKHHARRGFGNNW